VRHLAHQLRSEQLIFWRSREAAIFVFLFPPLLFVLLASVFGEGTEDGVPVASYLVAGLLGYAVANTALGGLAIMLVLRREYGILKRLRATPLPAATYLAAVLLSNLGVLALQAVTVLVLGVAFYGADLPAAPLSFVLALLFGAASFAGLGLAAAALIRSGEAVSAVVNVVVLPMAFLSGSFGSAKDLPGLLQVISDVLPLTYVIELVLATYVDGDPLTDHGTALGILALWGAAGYMIARRRFGWSPRER
jgi:ABC-2 type transport system permease protein